MLSYNIIVLLLQESVAIEIATQAISAIALSGIAGAFLGPNIANYAQNWIPQHAFVGSYLALAILVLIPAIILLWMQAPPLQSTTKDYTKGRTISQLAQQPNFISAVKLSLTFLVILGR